MLAPSFVGYAGRTPAPPSIGYRAARHTFFLALGSLYGQVQPVWPQAGRHTAIGLMGTCPRGTRPAHPASRPAHDGPAHEPYCGERSAYRCTTECLRLRASALSPAWSRRLALWGGTQATCGGLAFGASYTYLLLRSAQYSRSSFVDIDRSGLSLTSCHCAVSDTEKAGAAAASLVRACVVYVRAAGVIAAGRPRTCRRMRTCIPASLCVVNASVALWIIIAHEQKGALERDTSDRRTRLRAWTMEVKPYSNG